MPLRATLQIFFEGCATAQMTFDLFGTALMIMVRSATALLFYYF